MGKRAKALEPGDVISVPCGRSGRGFVLYLGDVGTFGPALGLFKDRVSSGTLPKSWKPRGVVAHPVFVHLSHVDSGRWLVVDRRSDLVSLFREPELFHDPKDDPGDGSYGPYGLAESAEGTIRKLDKKEAADIFGASEHRYLQVFLGDQFEHYFEGVLASLGC